MMKEVKAHTDKTNNFMIQKKRKKKNIGWLGHPLPELLATPKGEGHVGHLFWKHCHTFSSPCLECIFFHMANPIECVWLIQCVKKKFKNKVGFQKTFEEKNDSFISQSSFGHLYDQVAEVEEV